MIFIVYAGSTQASNEKIKLNVGVEIANKEPIGNKHQINSKARYSEISEIDKKAPLSLLYHKFKPI
jgi:hypothetical protein